MKRLRLMIVLCALGILLSVYMIFNHYQSQDSFCDISQTISCHAVNQSKWSEVGSLPLSLFGLFYYLVVLTLSLFIIQEFDVRRLHKRLKFSYLIFGVFFLTLFGFLFSSCLTYLELFVINAVCPMCVISYGFTFLIFVAACWNLYKFRKLSERKNI